MYNILMADSSIESFDFFKSFSVDFAFNSSEILEKTFNKNYHLIILDINYFETVKELREANYEAEVIFLDSLYLISNLKKALEVGDDYLIKPLSYEDLKIRIDYRFRKFFNHKSSTVKYKNFYLNLENDTIYKDKSLLKLSPNEFKLAKLLLLYKNKSISRDLIYETLNSHSYGSLRVLLSRLRKLGFEIDYDRVNISYKLK